MRPFITVLLIASLGAQSMAWAGGSVMGTEAMLQATTGEAAQLRSELQATLARDDVRQKLEAHGVDADMAALRVAALSDAEILELAESFDEAPAGSSVLAVIGVAFVVLLILELVGAVDIFKSI